MSKVMQLTYESSLTHLSEVNTSFDTGVLRICYTGENRNRTEFSREDIEKCMSTIYNCPIVCHYNREDGTFGGHDIEVVRDYEDQLRLVNLTQPVGVVPESANVWFDNVEEEDGTIHEYLFADVLLWKRQEAYKKIKEDGIASQSMEVTVKDGYMDNGIYHIKDFEFTAFAIIGVEPCFESAALETFSKADFKKQLSEMMSDLKDLYSLKIDSQNDDDKYTQNKIMKGGDTLEDNEKEVGFANTEDGANVEDEYAKETPVEGDPEDGEKLNASVNEDDNKENLDSACDDDDDKKKDFELNKNVRKELERSVQDIERDKDGYSLYWLVDYDVEKSEVYCEHCCDWLLYSFSYRLDGDAVVIDTESRKRVKYEIVDFVGGEAEEPTILTPVFKEMASKADELVECTAKYNAACETITSMEAELTELREFKIGAEANEKAAERNTVLEQFSDLEGVEEFSALKESCMDYEVSDLEEKCFALRGRYGLVQRTADASAPKLVVVHNDQAEEKLPYGGVVERYKNR